MKKNKDKIPEIIFLIKCSLCFLLFVGFVPYIRAFAITIINTGWLYGVIFTMVFLILQMNSRWIEQDWFNMFVRLFIYAIFVIAFDSAGNAFFNKPLEWITQPFGTLSDPITNTVTFGGAISWNVTFQILQDNGNVITIPNILILLYRAIQYAVWFVIVGYINEKTLIKLAVKIKTHRYKHYSDTIDADMEEKIKAEMHKREGAKQKKEVSEELYKCIKELKEKGDTIRAIKVLRDGTEGTWTLQEAKEFVDTVQEE